MYKHILYLPDGTVLSSGVPGKTAIRQVTLTSCVNTRQTLEPGCVSAAMLEAELLLPGPFALEAGQEVRLEQQDEAGQRRQIGIFRLEKPERTGVHQYKLTAYDRVSLLDRDLTQWLSGLEGWPYPLHRLAQLVCDECGLTLATEQIPNGEFPVQRFTGTNITGRMLMQWIAQAACRFCVADAVGQLRLDWYAPASDKLIAGDSRFQLEFRSRGQTLELEGCGIRALGTAEGLTLDSAYVTAVHDGALTLQLRNRQLLPCYRGGMEIADHTPAMVGRVRICQNQQDVGTVWESETEASDTCTVRGNPLLTATHAESLTGVARTIGNIMGAVRYRPCSLRLPAREAPGVGQIVTLCLPDGGAAQMYVMRSVSNGQTTRLECVGEPSRESSSAVNNQSALELGGKVLELQLDVDGLRVENRAADSRLSRIEADVSGVRTHVEDSRDALVKRLSTLEQSAQSLQLRLTRVDGGQENGAVAVTTQTGFTFDENGLRIAREGQQMENLLDHTGMRVNRLGQPVLQADSRGVVAVDVQVKNYLCIGSYARLEDHYDGNNNKRTACFFVG